MAMYMSAIVIGVIGGTYGEKKIGRMECDSKWGCGREGEGGEGRQEREKVRAAVISELTK